jgi:hypothetical protein
LIRRSLGTPSSCRRATARGKLMDLALAERIRIPAAGRLSCAADLEDWGAENGFPAVIKVDRSWGGLGVTVVRSIEQAREALWSAGNPSLFGALASLIVRRDPSHLLAGFRRERPSPPYRNSRRYAGESRCRRWEGNCSLASALPPSRREA